MPFSRPSLSDIINRIISDINTRVANSMTFLKYSVFKILGYVYGATAYLLYEYIQWTKDQLFISTSDNENLERHGSEYGITRNYGTKATGTITVSGVAATSVAASSEIQDITGQKYRIDTTVAIGGGGTVTANVTAEEAGNSYDQTVGTILTFISPIANVNADVTVISITGGVDEETDAEYRTRILNRKRYPPHGGAAGDYILWAKEYSGVTRAWEIEHYQGVGTIGLAFVRDDETDIFPNETIRNAVKTYIESHTDPTTGKTVGIPVTAKPGFFVLELEPYTMNFTIELSPNTSTVQTAVTAKLNDMILTYGGAGQTIYLSQMYEAITTALGETKSRIVYPTDNVTTSVSQVHVMGTITWSEYSG